MGHCIFYDQLVNICKHQTQERTLLGLNCLLSVFF